MILISIFFAGCSWFSIEKTEQSKQVSVPAGISPESSEFSEYSDCVQHCGLCEENCLNSVYYVKASSDENIQICSQITSPELQKECEDNLAAVIAVSQLNKEKCNSISDEAAQQNCLVHVSAEVALQSGNINKCDEATDVERCKNLFYKEMALLNNDISYLALHGNSSNYS